ncbi:MAG TPA: hypothetical protein VGQ17_04835 [Gemmatimonadales bacterium]|jgi:hypothetical protein|nr:hypothetical protein [Gemmatimonadales bacterium]
MPRFLPYLFVLGLPIPTAVAQGQTTFTATWKCSVVEPANAVPVPGQANHAYSVYQVKCTASSGQVAGVKEKEGTATEFAEVKGNTSKGHGIFVETLENGDTVTYDYQFTSTMNGKVAVSAGNTWKMVRGTGKAKGIKGSGSCKGKGNPDTSLSLECTGSYTTAM